MQAGSRSEAAGLARFERARPGEVGVDAAGVAGFVRAVEGKSGELGGLHSVMLVRRGKVVAEGWWRPYGAEVRHSLYSLTKSFTSTAVGMAVAEGRLSVEDRVVSIFPELCPTEVSDHLAAMRVKDLLTMCTGHAVEPPAPREVDWVRAFLAAEVKHPPGTHFLYNTPASHVLSAIVQKLTGQTLKEYLTPRLLEPLGIEGAVWAESPGGASIGGYGLSVRTEDIAAFGQMYLQRGVWQGRRLVAAAWVEAATSKQVPNGDPASGSDWNQGYGYQFWRCRQDLYRGDGAFGQYCIVMPRYDAVLAITGGVGDMGMVMQAAWDYLLPAMGDGVLGRSSAEEELASLMSSRELPHPAGAGGPGAGTGGLWRFEANGEGFESVRLVFGRAGAGDEATGDVATMAVTREGRTASAEVGNRRWVVGRSPFEAGPRAPSLSTAWSADPMAMSGAWPDGRTWVVHACYVQSPFVLRLTHRFEGDRLTLERRLNVGFGPTELPPLTARRVG